MQLSFNSDPQKPASLIFNPGEPLNFKVAAVLPSSLQGTSLDVHTTLSPVRGKDDDGPIVNGWLFLLMATPSST